MSSDKALVSPEVAPLEPSAPMAAAMEVTSTEIGSGRIFSDEAVQAAQEIRDMRRGDALGAATRLHRNLGRNSLFITNAAALEFATTVNDVKINAIPTGIVYEAAGLLVAGGLYAGGRLLERRKINGAEARGARIREGLGEPVDLFNVGHLDFFSRGGRRKRRTTVLRWYGCDEAFVTQDSNNETVKTKDSTDATAGTSDTNDTGKAPKLDPIAAVKGFETVVAFAKEAGIKEIAVSARLLDSIPETPGQKRKSFGTIVENDTLTKQKRVQVTDLTADKKVVRCDIQAAEALIAEIKEKTTMRSMQTIVDLLSEVRPNHPFLIHASNLMANGYTEANISEARKVLRAALEQKSGNGTSLYKHTGRYDGETTIAREYTFASLTGSDMRLVGTRQSLTGDGQSAHYKGIQSLLSGLGFETTEALVRDTDERRYALAPNVVQERAETAAWLLLQDDAPAVQNYVRPIAPGSTGSAGTPTTLLQRMGDERQRSLAWVLRRRGKVPEGEQTIEYTRARHTKHSRLKRAGGTIVMLAATSAAALTAGSLSHDGLNSLYSALREQYALEQGYEDGQLPYEEDDFQRYREESSSWQANVSGMFNDVSEFDGNISDAAAPYVTPLIPKALADKLMPYADRAWLFEKTDALENLNNAYSDGSDKSGVGDVGTDKNGIAWKLTANDDVSTEGYWAQGMGSYIDVQGSGFAGYAPPYREFGIQYGPNIRDRQTQAAYDMSYDRFVDLKDPKQIGPDSPYIKVEGQKLFDSSAMSQVALPNEELGIGYDDSAYGYALPVLVGSDVVAAKVERFALKDNRPLGSHDVRVMQLPNGMFYMLMDDLSFGDGESYVNITYWIDPKATTEREVRADMPLTMPGPGFDDMPFEEGMTNEQALRVWRTLSGNPNATELPTVEEAAAAVRANKKYSFTPYHDNHVLLTEDEPRSPGEGLAAVGVVASNMPTANCNVAATMILLASQGQTEDGGYVNPTTGYRNDGDAVLKTGEAHMWLTKDNKEIEDGTPSGGSPPPEGEGEGFDPNMNPGADILRTAQQGVNTLLVLALLAGGVRLVRRYAPRVVEGTRDRLTKAAAGRLHPGSGTEADAKKSEVNAETEVDMQKVEAEKQRVEAEKQRLHNNVSILQWILYSPEGNLDENALPKYFDGHYATDLPARYNALPPDLSAKQVRALINRLEKEGRLQLSDDTKHTLISFARDHVRHQAHQRQQIEQS